MVWVTTRAPKERCVYFFQLYFADATNDCQNDPTHTTSFLLLEFYLANFDLLDIVAPPFPICPSRNFIRPPLAWIQFQFCFAERYRVSCLLFDARSRWQRHALKLNQRPFDLKSTSSVKEKCILFVSNYYILYRFIHTPCVPKMASFFHYHRNVNFVAEFRNVLSNEHSRVDGLFHT